MEKKTIKVIINGTEYLMETELIYDDEVKVPFIGQQQHPSWNYENKIRSHQGRK